MGTRTSEGTARTSWDSEDLLGTVRSLLGRRGPRRVPCRPGEGGWYPEHPLPAQRLSRTCSLNGTGKITTSFPHPLFKNKLLNPLLKAPTAQHPMQRHTRY